MAARRREAGAYHRAVPSPKTISGQRHACRPVRSGADSTPKLARFAKEAATAVGRWLALRRQRQRDVGARTKHVGDPVTDLDLAGERRLRAAIAKRWPLHGFIGEETGATEVGRSHVWIVDPIDGTANFARNLQPWGVSVACLRDGHPIAGAVYAQPEDVTIVAAQGGGAQVGKQRLRIPEHAELDADSLVGVQWLRGATRLTFLQRLLSTGTRVRVFGSTVVQLCDVARGRLHANVQQQGKIWDVAAAGLIVQEGGGLFSRWDGSSIFPCTSTDLDRHHPSIAASPRVHRQIVGLLARRAVSPT